MSDRNEIDPIDARLAELGTLTEPLGARSGFTERVMLAALAESGWQVELLRSARRLIPIAALTAMLAVTWGWLSESSTDSELAAADETMEIEW